MTVNHSREFRVHFWQPCTWWMCCVAWIWLSGVEPSGPVLMYRITYLQHVHLCLYRKKTVRMSSCLCSLTVCTKHVGRRCEWHGNQPRLLRWAGWAVSGDVHVGNRWDRTGSAPLLAWTPGLPKRHRHLCSQESTDGLRLQKSQDWILSGVVCPSMHLNTG